MKKYIYSLAILMSAMTLNSCIGDLDTMPLNETDKTAEQVYVISKKVWLTFMVLSL
mgnify:CR=1 FL=1